MGGHWSTRTPSRERGLPGADDKRGRRSLTTVRRAPRTNGGAGRHRPGWCAGERWGRGPYVRRRARVREGDPSVTRELSRCGTDASGMKNANVIPFSPPDGSAPDGVHGPADGSPVSDGTRVLVDAERIVVERLVLVDAGLAGFIAERSPADQRRRCSSAPSGSGSLALQDAGVTVNVDVVRREFEALAAPDRSRPTTRPPGALDQVLRQNFADGDGRLPRTLEKFLGDRGQLRAFVEELFDETKRDSAIGRMRTLLGTYFDGDASRLALLLDPTRLHSPLHQFRTRSATGSTGSTTGSPPSRRPRPRGRASGQGPPRRAPTSRTCSRRCSATSPAAPATSLDRTGTEAGDVAPLQEGRLRADPRSGPDRAARSCGSSIEAKDRRSPGAQMRDELREAKTNRGAAVAARRLHADPRPGRHRAVRRPAGDVYCVLDPDAPDPAHARGGGPPRPAAGARVSLREHEVEVDAAAIRTALDGDPRAAGGDPGPQGPAHVDRRPAREGRLRPGWTSCARRSSPGSREAEAELRRRRELDPQRVVTAPPHGSDGA